MAQTQSAALTLTQMLALLKEHLVDLDTLNPQFTDAQYTDDLNNAYALWYQQFSRRVANLTGADTFGALAAQDAAGLTATSTATNVTEWLRLFLDPSSEAGSNFAVGPELEIMDAGLVKQLQDGDATAGQPKVAAVYKLQSSAAAAIGKWGLFLYPIPDAAYWISAMANVAPYNLDSTVGTDRFDVTEAESRIIVAVAAARVAKRQGRDLSLIAAIESNIPADVQALLVRKAEGERSKDDSMTGKV
jgi:hypothetical protein